MKRLESFQNIIKSKFFRSLAIKIVLVILIVIIAIITFIFNSFSNEINKRIISEREKQLETIEDNISKRLNEVLSIAYNISINKSFLLESINETNYSSYEMAKTLEKYLTGNDFIQYMAYYRLSEPEVIYTASGKLGFSDFWTIYLNITKETSNQIIQEIQNCKNTTFLSPTFFEYEMPFFAYTYPIPQFSKNPKAFVIMLIPESKIRTILEAQLSNCYGQVNIFDTNKNEIYKVNNLGKEISIDISTIKHNDHIKIDNEKYIVQIETSDTNGWTYVSTIRLTDIVSGTAAKQLVFILLLLVLMLVAFFLILLFIVIQYRPINDLAVSVRSNSENSESSIIDEEHLLSDTIATLQDDSIQKQKFEAAYYEAEAASKAKSDFLSNMSHDIRTPMNTIIGLTEIASKHIEDKEYITDSLTKISMASQYLLDIINNVLDMSRIESGKFTLSEEVINLPKIIHNIMNILNHSLEIKNQKLLVQVNDIHNENFLGDSVRLTQVFMNILSNSIKFTPTGGTLKITITQENSEDPQYANYTIVFNDNGIGISKEFISKVFETFSRDEKSTISKTQGTGLGMAIVKNLIDLMGGEIKCESKLNEGTTFTVQLHQKIVNLENKSTTFNKINKSILIINGEDYLVKNEVNTFHNLGVKITHAENLQEAIENINSNSIDYDFIFINQSDDDKNGVNCAKEILTHYKNTKPELIFASTNFYSIEKSEASNSGIDFFVQLPLFPSTAINIINKEFKTKESENSKKIVYLQGKNILLIDDHELNREIAHNLINETKANVIEAGDGKEAFDIYMKEKEGFFDLILMDIQMPVMNGYESTSAIRSANRKDSKSIPIYAMTANTFDSDVRQIKEAGMNGHIGKPYVSEELYKILETAILKS